MQQQRLQLSAPALPPYHTWVHHQGTALACARIAVWFIEGGIIWLKSDIPAGKSHLLQALKQEHPQLACVHVSAKLTPLKQVAIWLEHLEAHAFWSVDLPAGALPHTLAIALFHLIERAKEMNRPLLIAWRCHDDALAPAELASRMRMMEQVHISPPERDPDLRAVLQAVGKQLHWDIPENFLKVMLSHLARDLETQIQALKHLEAASLEERARMTQTWAKQTLNI